MNVSAARVSWPVRGGIAAAVAAGVVVTGVVLLPPPSRPIDARVVGLQYAAAAVRGEGPRADLAQDYLGARALRRRDDPYPVLGPELETIGVNWDVKERSTHPPTAFLLALPISWLPWPRAEQVWAIVMILATLAAVWLMAGSLPAAIAGGALVLLWPPAAWSVQQLTPIWLLSVALAFRWRAQPSRAGLVIGLAALTKITPLLLVVPFVLKRQWKAVYATAGVVAAALATLVLWYPAVLKAYLDEGRPASEAQLHRPDNAGTILAASHVAGRPGIVAAVVVIVAIVGAGVHWRERSGSWWIWPWLSVAVLPIAWIYSLLPLLPGLLVAMWSDAGRRWAWAAVVPAAIVVPFGSAFGAAGVALSICLTGIAASAVTAKEHAAATAAGRVATSQV
jgi:Glycosyltransferase family 87